MAILVIPARNTLAPISIDWCPDCPGLTQYELLRMGLIKSILLKLDPMAATDTNSLLNAGRCFQCYGLSMAETMELSMLKLLLDASIDIVTDDTILENVEIPFTLISGTTDSVTYNLAALGVGWKVVAWDWFVSSTPAAWGGVAAALAMNFYYDIEDNVGLTDSVELHTGDLAAGIPAPTPSQTGLSPAQPLFFKHVQSPQFIISWDAVPDPGETVVGFVRLLVKQETTI